MSLYSILPGVPLPVSEVSTALAHMWDGDTEGGSGAPSEFHAIQMNLVLHFGPDTTEAEAEERFNIAVTFAQRYPCRIIVLCTHCRQSNDKSIQTKLFSQCYIGPTFRQMCCCEALIIGYCETSNLLLDQQISVWLDNDLPIYSWLHRVPIDNLTDPGWSLTRRSRRLVIDTAVDPHAYAEIEWPATTQLTDLAHTRGLTIRQTLGHWLSSFSPVELIDGLQHVEQSFAEGYEGEARALMSWLQRCLQSCAQVARIDDFEPQFQLLALTAEAPESLVTRWRFKNNKSFTWTHNFQSRASRLTAQFDEHAHDHPLRIRQVPPELALSEALFF